MPFRFQKRIKIFPGVHLNISGSGVTTSLGTKGITVNLRGSGKVKTTVGIPGTGINYSETTEADKSSLSPGEVGTGQTGSGVASIVVVVVVALVVLWLVA